MFIIVAILIFGILIAVHELGHFIMAKTCGVKVNEFSIGMGPAVFKKQKGETLYSMRLIPIGGYCAMEGEDEDSEDPRSFGSKNPIQKILILVAGSFTNFMTGLLIVVILFSSYSAFASNEIAGFADGFELSGENGLMAGDKIISVDGERIHYADDFSVFMARANGENVTIVVNRGGKNVTLRDFPLQLREYTSDGVTSRRYGINFGLIEGNFFSRLQYSFYTAGNFVRDVRMGLGDLITGRAGIEDMAGPVGIVTVISDVAEQSDTVRTAIMNVAYLCAFLAINLAVMNMLPIPALDGGRVFFVLINAVYTLITKKTIDPKYEGYIHTVGLILLLALMAVVMFNDIRRLI